MSKRKAPDSNNSDSQSASSRKHGRLDSWLKGTSKRARHDASLQRDDAPNRHPSDHSNQKSLHQPKTGFKPIEAGVKPNKTGVKTTETEPQTAETEFETAEDEIHSTKTIKPTETKPKPKRIHIIEETGDIFAADPNTILIHACNCEGSWGGGIAKAFKDRYPNAYSIYNTHCRTSKQPDLPGTALLIPPQSSSKHKRESDANHFIGCLFTSQGKGKTKSSPKQILADTGPSMLDLLNRIAEWNVVEGRTKIGDLRMCRINSGLFDVKWADTKTVLEELEVDEDLDILVVER